METQRKVMSKKELLSLYAKFVLIALILSLFQLPYTTSYEAVGHIIFLFSIAIGLGLLFAEGVKVGQAQVNIV